MRFLIVLLIVSMFTGCVSADKSNNGAESHFLLGISYLQTNDATQALRELLLAEDIEDDDAPLQAALGQAYFLKKAYTRSEKHYLRSLKIDKDNPKYQNNLAALYMEMQRWDEAIIYFHKAASNLLFAHPEVSWTGYGYAYFMKGDYMKAIDAYMKAIGHNWRYPQAYVRRGETFHALDQSGKAIADYKQALEIFPNYTLAHYNMAVSSMKIRKVTSAIKHFNRVVELDPNSDMAHQARSYLLVLK